MLKRIRRFRLSIQHCLVRINTLLHGMNYIIFSLMKCHLIILLDWKTQERKAEYFASRMLLGNLMSYFTELPEAMDFRAKVYNCMDVFQAPYKAVLIELYEKAAQTDNSVLMGKVKENFENDRQDISECFRELGLDNTLVLPSNVVDVSALYSKIKECERDRPDLGYHKDNERFLEKVVEEIKQVKGGLYA